MLANASLRNISFGTFGKSSASSQRSAQDDNDASDLVSIHEEFISQLENPTAKKDDLIKEYSSLNVRMLEKKRPCEYSRYNNQQEIDNESTDGSERDITEQCTTRLFVGHTNDIHFGTSSALLLF